MHTYIHAYQHPTPSTHEKAVKRHDAARMAHTSACARTHVVGTTKKNSEKNHTCAGDGARKRDGVHPRDFVHAQCQGVAHGAADGYCVRVPVNLGHGAVVAHNVQGGRRDEALIHEQGERGLDVKRVAAGEADELWMTRHLRTMWKRASAQSRAGRSAVAAYMFACAHVPGGRGA